MIDAQGSDHPLLGASVPDLWKTKARDDAMTGGSGTIVRRGRAVRQWGDRRQTYARLLEIRVQKRYTPG